MAPHMHPDDPSRMAVPYPYMPMNSNGVMAGHMFNWGGGGAGGNSAFQVRWRRCSQRHCHDMHRPPGPSLISSHVCLAAASCDAVPFAAT